MILNQYKALLTDTLFYFLSQAHSFELDSDPHEQLFEHTQHGNLAGLTQLLDSGQVTNTNYCEATGYTSNF